MAHLKRDPSLRVVLAIVVATVLAGLSLGCSNNPPPDTSQLSPVGLRDFHTAKFVDGLNSVTQTIIAANDLNKLSDAHTAAALTVNKQILDYLAANPQATREKVFTAIKNARDALPADVDAVISGFILQVTNLLMEVQ